MDHVFVYPQVVQIAPRAHAVTVAAWQRELRPPVAPPRPTAPTAPTRGAGA